MKPKNRDAWEFTKIKAAVVEAEFKSAGQIVPMIVSKSGDYRDLNSVFALAFLAFVSFFYWAFATYFERSKQFEEITQIQVIAAVSGYFLAAYPPLGRVLAGKRRLAENMRKCALAAFMQNGISETHNRGGVLIYISLFEKSAEILGDKGIHDLVGEGFWKTEIDKLSTGVRSGKIEESLLQCVKEIGEKLAEYLPRGDRNENQLEDHLRTG